MIYLLIYFLAVLISGIDDLLKIQSVNFNFKINPYAVLFIGIIVLQVTISQFPFYPFKDYFQFGINLDSVSLFYFIVGTLASFSGIVIAVIILSLDIISSKITKSQTNYLSGNIYLKQIFYLFSACIISGISAIFILGICIEAGNEVALKYFVLSLFFVCMILILPLGYKSIKSVDVFAIIKNEINSLEGKHVNLIASHNTYLTTIEYSQYVNNSPITILLDLAKKNLNNDTTVVIAIARELSIRFLKLSKDLQIREDGYFDNNLLYNSEEENTIYSERIEFFKPYLNFINSLFEDDSKYISSSLIDVVIYDLSNMIIDLKSRRIHNLMLTELFDTYQSIYKYVLVKGKKDLFPKMSVLTCRLFGELFKYCPPSIEIADIERILIKTIIKFKTIPRSGFEWSLLNESISKLTFGLLDDSLADGKLSSYNYLCSNIGSLQSEIVESKHLDELQKFYLIISIQLNCESKNFQYFNKVMTPDEFPYLHNGIIDSWTERYFNKVPILLDDNRILIFSGRYLNRLLIHNIIDWDIIQKTLSVFTIYCQSGRNITDKKVGFKYCASILFKLSDILDFTDGIHQIIYNDVLRFIKDMKKLSYLDNNDTLKKLERKYDLNVKIYLINSRIFKWDN